MNKRIISIWICMLMLFATFISVAGTMNNDENSVERQRARGDIEPSIVEKDVMSSAIISAVNSLNSITGYFPEKNKIDVAVFDKSMSTIDDGYQDGWPQIITSDEHIWGGMISPVVTDLDRDGFKELILTQQGEPSKLYIFEQNGSLKCDVIEMPYDFQWICPRHFLSISDIDNDGFEEIIFEAVGPSNNKEFRIYNYNGTLKDEWILDYRISDDLYSSIVLADLDFDGNTEVIYNGWWIDGPRLIVLDNQGNTMPGFPVMLENIQMAESNTPAVGNFDGDPELEIVAISHENNQPEEKSNIRCFNNNGSLLWEQEIDTIIYNDPSVGDINHDGFDEVIFASKKGIHVLDRRGKYLVDKGLGINGDSSNVALADLDGDKNLEVIFGYRTKMYAMDYTGNILWSYDTGWNAHYPPVVGDITGDGIPDIVANSDYEIWAWDAQGKLIGGFPKNIVANAYGACSLADIDNDGDIELIASSDWKWNNSNNIGYVYVWDLPGTYDPSTMEWPMYQHNIRHTGLYPRSDELIANAGGPYEGFVNDPIQFNGYAFGGSLPYIWSWDFGDGNTSDIQNPVHTYDSADTYTITLTVIDSDFNSSIATTTATIISEDDQPPVTTHTFDGNMGENSWYVGDVYVTITAEDDSSGVDYTMYKLDGGDWQEYDGAFIVTVDGMHNLSYYSVDNVGNKENDSDPFDFKIDQTAPTINLEAEDMGGNEWLLTATVSDATSGVAKVEFYLNDELLGGATESPYEWIVSDPDKGDKAHAVAFDNAGNDARSEDVDAVSQSRSQRQSSSSTSVLSSTSSNPEPQLDVGRVWLRGLLCRCNRVGNVNHAMAIRLHYIEFTPTERTTGMVTMNNVIFKDSAHAGRMYEIGLGLFTYVIGFFEGGLEIL